MKTRRSPNKSPGPDQEIEALLELVRFRTAQLMNCTGGMESHHRQLLALGESTSRMKAVSQWKKSRCFDARERAALALCDKIALDPEEGPPQDRMAEIVQMKDHFTNDAIIKITMAILAVTEWTLVAG